MGFQLRRLGPRIAFNWMNDVVMSMGRDLQSLTALQEFSNKDREVTLVGQDNCA